MKIYVISSMIFFAITLLCVYWLHYSISNKKSSLIPLTSSLAAYLITVKLFISTIFKLL